MSDVDFMGNPKVIIAIVVGIIVIKLLAVHLYLKTKNDGSKDKKDNDKK
ncbi:MAG: hypothetical protein JKY19_15115 [Alcanivoracaceae bacterium]|nr:hypothetical protein [Alcanivoracaceae bacterium]